MDFITNGKCREAEQWLVENGWIKNDDGETPYPHNMTRKQWRHELAARAMDGELASQSEKIGEYLTGEMELLAKRSYQAADAMLKEGEKF